MIYELWKSESYDFFRKDENYEEKLSLLDPQSKKIWEYKAKSHFEAMQAYYDYQGWGTYRPEPDWTDEYFDEDRT